MDKEWYNFWEKKALLEDESLCVGRGVEHSANIIAQDIIEKLNFKKTDTILDIGCGGGEISRLLADRVNRIIGCEISMNMAKRANNKNINNFVCIIASGEVLPFRDGCFDKVIAYSSVFSYLKKYNESKECLKNIYRICKEGGEVLIGELHDKAQKWRVAPSRIRVFLSKVKKRILKSNKQNSDMINKDDKYFQKKWLYENLWYSRKKITKIANRIGFRGGAIDRSSRLPYFEREFDMLLIKNKTKSKHYLKLL